MTGLFTLKRINHSLISLFTFVFWLIWTTASAFAQDTVTVMTYNVLHFSNNESRVQYFKKVFDYVQPDLVIMNELEDEGGLDYLLNRAFNYADTNFAAAPLPASQYMKNGLIYRKDTFSLVDHVFISTYLRDISGFTLALNNAHQNVPPFSIFSMHLKASDGTANADQRWEEAHRLADYIDQQGTDFQYIAGGDFNVYGPDEKAYKLLTDSLKIDLVDPIGYWQHNDGSFAAKYTQSTRDSYLSDGGSTGGLDDRFDFLLFSHQFTAVNPDLRYLEGSSKAVGNDGQHFNQSINAGTNSAVPDSIAEALYYASDHLPVIARIVYTTKTTTSPVAYAGADQTASVGSVVTLTADQSYDPNGTIVSYLWEQTAGPTVSLSSPTNSQATFTVPEVTRTTAWTFKLTVTDNDGETGIDYVNITVPVSGSIALNDIQYTTDPGIGNDCYPAPLAGQVVEVEGVVTGVRPNADYPNFFLQDPERQAWGGLYVYVNKGYTPPQEGDLWSLKGNISEYYGLTELKNIQSSELLATDQLVEPVTITASTLAGGCTSWGEPLEGMLVRLIGVDVTYASNQYNEWQVSDWSGTCIVDDYLFAGDWPQPAVGDHFDKIEGIVTYSFGQFKILPRDSNDFHLDDSLSVVSEVPRDFKLLTNYPNPFNPVTTIEFQLDRTATGELVIYDLTGRRLLQLWSGVVAGGKLKQVQWSGHDGDGNPLSGGIYIARLKAGSIVLTRKMVLLK
ncbi:MAG: endonuclease/exonuclease/phosphatase family protein [Fidelibacterota bacterium]